MPERKVTLSANAGLFRGLAKQNMLFHQAIGELVDNAIAARRDGQKFRIEINLTPLNGDGLQIDISDNGKGMNVETLSRALEPGQSATTTDRLNEHGFGLKNALATLSGGNGWWQLWTRQDGEGPFIGVQGPFEQTMVIEDPAQKPEGGTLSPDLSTLIRTRSSMVSGTLRGYVPRLSRARCKHR
jgi:sensor histidine kinase regulating citrate/malate metabolism